MIIKVLPVILLILTGLLIRRVLFLTEDTIGGVKKIVTHLALPSVLFLAFSTTELEVRFIAIVLVIFVVCGLMVFFGRLLGKILGITTPYFALLMGGFEAGMLGYSLFLTAFGQEAVAAFAIVDLGHVVFVFFVLVTLLITLRDGAQSPRDTFLLFIKSPVIIAIVVGIVDSLIRHHIGYGESHLYLLLTSYLTMLSNLTVPLICLVIGYELGFSLSGLKLPLVTLAVRYGVLIILAVLLDRFFISKVFLEEPMFRNALYVMFILPPPFVIPLFMGAKDKENRNYVVNTLSISTVISLVLFLIVLGFLAPA